MKNKFNFEYRIFISLLSLIIGTAIVLTITSCTHPTDNLYFKDSVCFESDILPIFQTNCAISGCHDGSIEELKFTDYSSIMNAITPHDHKNSQAYEAITGTWGELMPPSPRLPLSQEQRTLIYLWIEQGAKNTTCN